MGLLSDTYRHAQPVYQQLAAALEQSNNLGLSINGEPQYLQSCQEIAQQFGNQLDPSIRYFSFDTNGDGIGNFQVCCTYDDAARALPENAGVTYDDLIVRAKGCLEYAGVTNYTLFVDREAGKFILTTHAVPGLDNYKEEFTEISDEKTPRSPSAPQSSSASTTQKTPKEAIGVMNEKGEEPEYTAERTESSRKTVQKGSTNTNEFYKDCIVLIEGIQVPYTQISVSYGVTAPPSCTLIIPAHKVIREVMKYAPRVHIFFKDLLPDSDGVYEYRLLFDGFLTSFTYGTDDTGAQMSLNGLHSCAYLQLMQIMTLDPAQYLFNTSKWIAGTSTVPILFAQNRVHSSMIEQICKQKVKSMADIVFKMLQAILLSDNQTATAKYYRKVLGNDPGGWKILKRIFGVSKYAKESEIPQTSWDKGALSRTASTTAAGKVAEVINPELVHKTSRIGFPCTGSVTSGWGYRTHPISGKWKMHDGIDIGANNGTPIYATHDGTVTFAGWEDGGYGNKVSIENGGLMTFYAHMEQVLVSEGTQVTKGTLIGLVGDTGYSDGDHLHMGLYNNGKSEDPREWF